MYIGILTYHRAHNYGAFLQACSLCNRLNMEDNIDAEIIDFRMKKEKKKYSVYDYGIVRKLIALMKFNYKFRKVKCRSFEKAQNLDILIKSEQYIESDLIEDFNTFVYGKYDVIIAGSDEIWKVNSFRGFPSPYWLIGNLGCKKVSYAASARVDFRKELTDENYGLLVKTLKEYEYIGVRDQWTYDEIVKALGNSLNVYKNCDPSFLYDFHIEKIDIYSYFTDKSKIKKNKKNVLIMVENRRVAQSLRKQLNAKYNLLSVCNSHIGMINISDLGPIEWLQLIYSVDFVIASYFHAICYSIIFNKPFLAIGTKMKESKLIDLLSQDNSLISHYLNIDKIGYKKIDWNSLIEQPELKVVSAEFVEQQRQSFETFLNNIKTIVEK